MQENGKDKKTKKEPVHREQANKYGLPTKILSLSLYARKSMNITKNVIPN
jgi:hypothetical protein